MGSEKSMGGQTADRAAVTFFATAAEADRRIAGVAAAAPNRQGPGEAGTPGLRSATARRWPGRRGRTWTGCAAP